MKITTEQQHKMGYDDSIHMDVPKGDLKSIKETVKDRVDWQEKVFSILHSTKENCSQV